MQYTAAAVDSLKNHVTEMQNLRSHGSEIMGQNISQAEFDAQVRHSVVVVYPLP